MELEPSAAQLCGLSLSCANIALIIRLISLRLAVIQLLLFNPQENELIKCLICNTRILEKY